MHLLLAALLVAADQAAKWLAANSFSGGQSIELGLGFRLTFVRNTGAAFGLLRDFELAIGPVTIDGTLMLGVLSATVALVLLAYLVRGGARMAALSRAALLLVFAGAVGNMIDRLLLGYVIDFIHFRTNGFDFPVFNLADCYVVIGGGLLLLTGMAPHDDAAEQRRLAEPDFFRGLDHRDR